MHHLAIKSLNCQKVTPLHFIAKTKFFKITILFKVGLVLQTTGKNSTMLDYPDPSSPTAASSLSSTVVAYYSVHERPINYSLFPLFARSGGKNAFRYQIFPGLSCGKLALFWEILLMKWVAVEVLFHAAAACFK